MLAYQHTATLPSKIIRTKGEGKDMSPAAPIVSPSMTTAQPAPAMMITEIFAKDAIISWFRGEFAAANAMIDALCGHLAQLEGGSSEYETVFASIHRRRLNWIPILQMQKYFSIADVTLELQRVAEKKAKGGVEGDEVKNDEKMKVFADEEKKSREVSEEESMESVEYGGGEVMDEDSTRPESEITDTGSQEQQPTSENVDLLCSNHEDCEARHALIKMTKGFVAKEPVKGHMVNVVRGLKLYEDVFTGSEISKLNDLVNELRAAGQNGELSGVTYILYNQQMKGHKRELIQLGAPIFGHSKEEATGKYEESYIEPIPNLLQGVIDHLLQWHLIQENRRPNSCIINFFDQGEYSQPFLKPPHLEQPISTLLLSESTMSFGRTLVSDADGNYKGPLMLSLKKGSLLVMRGNSSDMARHVMCQSPNKRVSIMFFRVLSNTNQNDSSTIPHLTRAMTLCQSGVPNSYTIPNGAMNDYEATTDIIPKWGKVGYINASPNPACVGASCTGPPFTPKWGVLHAPVVMFAAPMQPMGLSPRSPNGNGTGVFLPWASESRKPPKHLPPRAQKGRLLALSSSVEMLKTEPTMDDEGKKMG